MFLLRWRRWLVRFIVVLCLKISVCLVVSPARLIDIPGASDTIIQSFGGMQDLPTPLAKFVWCITLFRRLNAINKGELQPHCLLVAKDGKGVVGVAEIGLLPVPPGHKAKVLNTKNSPINAMWRGVSIFDKDAFRNDVPTLANVAVSPRARRLGIGKSMVARAIEIVNDDREYWHRPPYLYARVTDPKVLPFWQQCGFNILTDVPSGAADIRGAVGTWLAISLSSAER
mmetsp:Transcript_19023/g.24660  ORF Transcript_19023/g.24660 Transcript_19023/m.24660 type:complete len:228 (+) Transcript_19023:32-715(+)